MAPVPEPRPGRDLRPREVVPAPRELLGPLHPAGDNVLVWEQLGGRLERPGEGGGTEVDDGSEVAHRYGGVAMLLDGIEDGSELRQLRSGGQAATRAKPGLGERRRFVGNHLEPSLTLRKT
jgi:hypothetical protein